MHRSEAYKSSFDKKKRVAITDNLVITENSVTFLQCLLLVFCMVFHASQDLLRQNLEATV